MYTDEWCAAIRLVLSSLPPSVVAHYVAWISYGSWLKLWLFSCRRQEIYGKLTIYIVIQNVKLRAVTGIWTCCAVLPPITSPALWPLDHQGTINFQEVMGQQKLVHIQKPLHNLSVITLNTQMFFIQHLAALFFKVAHSSHLILNTCSKALNLLSW